MTLRIPTRGTRERVLEVARELFASQGYDRTSLREISGRLGFSKAALYYHFRAKEDILFALAGDLIDQVDRIAQSAESRGERDQRAREELLVSLVDLLLVHRATAELLMTEGLALAHTDLGARAHQLLQRVQRLLLPDSPTVADRVRASAAVGVLQSALLNLADVEPEQLRALVTELALTCLRGGRR